MRFYGILLLFVLALSACAAPDTEIFPPDEESIVVPVHSDILLNVDPPPRIADIPLVIVGEGGTSGTLFEYAAETYVRENGGLKYTVHSGDEFINVMKDFAAKNGLISHFVYIGHGNEVGLYVNQTPHVNGALYANDPGLDTNFRAASIYELPPSLFASGSTALFFGCNVARVYEGQDSFAEQFANHFRTLVRAPIGPTEFSFQQSEKRFVLSPVIEITQPLYMVPTVQAKGFITIEPSTTGIAGYNDVYASMEAAGAITQLSQRGLTLVSDRFFVPYRSITYVDARVFCRLINPQAACSVENVDEGSKLRNTAALKMLLDAAGFTMKRTHIPYQVQIAFATKRNLLTRDFIRRRWYSRAEMAMLTSAILAYTEQGK